MKAENAARKVKASAPKVLELEYDLSALPSSQHRAGLAGLALMVEWLERSGERERGVCEIVRGERTLRLRVDQEGLAALLDEVYAASMEEIAVSTPYKNKPPLRTYEQEVTAGPSGKSKTKVFHVYPQVVPAGAFRQAWERTPDGDGKGLWTKLWRDMVWSILRGVPATRKPFELRAEEKPSNDAAKIWKELAKRESSVPLPSTYYLGAQDRTAENVAFRDQARDQLLLHFWPFVAEIYVPVEIDNDGKTKHRGYAVTVPDVTNLELFCDDLGSAMSARDDARAGYRPRQSLIDVSLQAGLDFFARLKPQLQLREGRRRYADVLAGVDVFHVEKEGNNIRMRGVGRVDPDEGQIKEYIDLRGRYFTHDFRRQRMENLVRRRPWYEGFDRLLSTTAWQRTIGSRYFPGDVRKAFDLEIEQARLRRQQEVATMTETSESNVSEGPSLESLIYNLAQSYVLGKTASKYGLQYDKVKGNPKELHDYSEARAKIAREAFLGVRSRTGEDFVAYFTATLCSVPRYMNEEAFKELGCALLDESKRDKVRTLTLLALCAHGWSPQQKEEKPS